MSPRWNDGLPGLADDYRAAAVNVGLSLDAGTPVDHHDVLDVLRAAAQLEDAARAERWRWVHVGLAAGVTAANLATATRLDLDELTIGYRAWIERRRGRPGGLSEAAADAALAQIDRTAR